MMATTVPVESPSQISRDEHQGSLSEGEAGFQSPFDRPWTLCT